MIFVIGIIVIVGFFTAVTIRDHIRFTREMRHYIDEVRAGHGVVRIDGEKI